MSVSVCELTRRWREGEQILKYTIGMHHMYTYNDLVDYRIR